MTGGGAARVRLLQRSAEVGNLLDWGPIAQATGGAEATASRTSGVLLYKGPEGSPEAGLWECTPGTWDCRVTRDEFCHFLSGRCVYAHESGERTEIEGGDTAFFPAGWSGRCQVLQTVRKVYMIR